MRKSRDEVLLLYDDTMKLLVNYGDEGFEKIGGILNQYKYDPEYFSSDFDQYMVSELKKFLTKLKS